MKAVTKPTAPIGNAKSWFEIITAVQIKATVTPMTEK